MASALDSTHTVVVRSENRGLRVVIGLVAILLWARWWWSGALLAAVAFAVPHPPESEGFSSITGTLLPIAVDLLWFVGSVVIFALTKSAAIVWDVISGVFETFKHYSDRRAAVEAAKQAATKSGTDAGLTNAGAIAGTGAVQAAETEAKKAAAPRSIDMNKVAAAIIDHEKRLMSSESSTGLLHDVADDLQDRQRSLEGAMPDVSANVERAIASIASIQSDARAIYSYLNANEQVSKLIDARVAKLEASMLQDAEPAPEPVKAPSTARRTPAKPKAKAR